MVHASEVYQWFKELAAHSRIEFACSLLHLCIPNELRFISTLLEDINNKDYPSLRETEEICNNPNEFIQYSHSELNSESVNKLCLSLSLLKPTNQILAQRIYEILRIHFHYLCQCVMLNDSIKCEVMLLYALASNHPAFTFQCRQNLAEYFTTLLGIYNDDSDISVNCNNSALKEPWINRCEVASTVVDVFIEKNDAKIILEIVSTHGKNECRTQRQCLYSKIKSVVGNVLSTDHDFYRQMVAHNSNGSFTARNIRDIISKILLFALSESVSDDAKEISSFFLRLPLWGIINESYSNFQINDPRDTSMSPICDRVPAVFQNVQRELYLSESVNSESSTISCEPSVYPQETTGHQKPPAVSVPKSALFDITTPIKTQIKNIAVCDGEIQNTFDQHYDSKSLHDEPEKDPRDRLLMPLQMLGSHIQPCYRYIIPSYHLYPQSKSCASCSYVISSNNPSEVPNLPPALNGTNNTPQKLTQSYLSDSLMTTHCHTPTFFQMSPQPPHFTPVHFLSFDHYNGSILSNAPSQFLLSNVVNRSQPTTMTLPQPHIRQKSTQPFPNTSQ